MGEHAVVTGLYGNHSYRIIEAGMAMLVLLVALAAPVVPGAAWQRARERAARLANRRTLAVVLVGLAAPILRLAILPVAPIPQPYSHDEFSYLLAADTFSSGRITNPTHPMWQHFESFHINQQPTYMSMYFPGQGLVLAFGQTVLGHPWYGVVVSVGLLCAAICWMLQGWVTPGWALVGGVLAVLRLGVFGYWMNSYWGGAVAATGGALLMGAIPRLMREPRVSTAVWMAVGLAILANSRPFEGTVLSISAAVALIVFAGRDLRAKSTVLLRRVVAPAAAVLLLTAGAMAYYNWRVFGKPTTLPYTTNRSTYAVAPVFFWQSPGVEPAYRHPVMRDFYVSWELRTFEQSRTIGGFLSNAFRKFGVLLMFYFGAVLVIPLVMVRRVWHERSARFLLLTAALFLAGLMVNAFTVPHYMGPAMGIYYAILLMSMRQLEDWRPGGQPAGRFLLAAIPVLCVGLFFTHLFSVASAPGADTPRVAVQHTLEKLPGGQLAIVRYSPGHDAMAEWVYNTADIDGSKIVWAREMSRAQDRELLEYFHDRTAWLVQADRNPPEVTPYAR